MTLIERLRMNIRLQGIDDWERVLDATGERVTIRTPHIYKQQMEVRARTAGRSINEEYGRAVEAWCAGGEGWTRLLLPVDAIHEWVTKEVVLEQQLAAVLVECLEMDGKVIGLSVAGYAITLNREWFVGEDAFDRVRSPLAAQLPLLAESGGGWGPGPHQSTVFTYGRIGDSCRKSGCKAGATELVTLTHTDPRGKAVTIDVPLCKTHALETRATIASGEAPKFMLG
ncbi:MAG: hypothetical protein DLM66_03680 [Candidatus Dormiibacter spiritus]|nr:MAG: hypothetical protein DLM66_03680 [Candidatus Dormibacteraeota bacterium]